ncbi:MAG: sugar phosphate isomerase/epimerase family protein [Thermoproteota archaeon]|nr:sugar phosphate isomerase/epimerase [Candidatus Brockarchaeota archaeon]
MDYGFDSWIYSILDLEKALERFSANGVRFIEISFEHLSKISRNNEVDSNALKRIRELEESLGFKIIQVHGPLGNIEFDFASEDDNRRNKALRKLCNWIKYISEFELGVFILHTARIDPSHEYNSLSLLEKSRSANIRFFREVSKYASDYGVKVAVENRLENGYGALPKDLIELVNNVGSDYLGICFDTGHAHVNKLNLESTLESIREFLIATHIHDNNGFEDQHLPPMMGSMQWNVLMKTLRKIDYRNPLILEIHEYGKLELDDNVLKASIILMNELIKESF